MFLIYGKIPVSYLQNLDNFKQQNRKPIEYKHEAVQLLLNFQTDVWRPIGDFLSKGLHSTLDPPVWKDISDSLTTSMIDEIKRKSVQIIPS